MEEREVEEVYLSRKESKEKGAYLSEEERESQGEGS